MCASNCVTALAFCLLVSKTLANSTDVSPPVGNGVNSRANADYEDDTASPTDNGGQEIEEFSDAEIMSEMKKVEAIAGYQRASKADIIRAKPLPNYKYVGLGFDYIKGDLRPLTNSLDSAQLGWRNSVLKLSDSYRFAFGVDYYASKSVDVLDQRVCVESDDAEVIRTARSYSFARSQQVRAQAGLKAVFPKFGFFGSSGFKKTSTFFEMQANGESKIVVESWIRCTAYEAKIAGRPTSPDNLTVAFHEDVLALPTVISSDADQRLYDAFIERYGTHVVTGATMGSMAWSRYVLTSDNWAKATSKTLATEKNFGAGLSDAKNILRMRVSKNQLSSEQIESAESFERLAEKKESYSIGGEMTPNWANDRKVAFQNPMPLDLTLMRVADLLTPQLFPHESARDLARKRRILMRTYTQYCTRLAATDNVALGESDCRFEHEREEDVRQESLFGGIYGNAGSLKVTNHVSGNFYCPDGYVHRAIGKIDETELQLCLHRKMAEKRVVDAENTFGGMYHKRLNFDPLGCNWNGCNRLGLNDCPPEYPNPLTNDFSCPPGFNAIEIAHESRPIQQGHCAANYRHVFYSQNDCDRCGKEARCEIWGIKCGGYYCKSCEATVWPCCPACTAQCQMGLFACFKRYQTKNETETVATPGNSTVPLASPAVTPLLGGFYAHNAGPNPATGVYSCPRSYAAVRLFSFRASNSNSESHAYVCLYY